MNKLWRGRLLLGLLLVASVFVASQYKVFWAAYRVRDLGDANKAVRFKAAEDLAELGEPGLTAAQSWLDRAEAGEYSNGYGALSSELSAAKVLDRLGPGRIARFHLSQRRRNPINLGMHEFRSGVVGRLVRVEEEVEPVCEELEALLKEPVIPALELIALARCLCVILPQGRDRSGPLLEEVLRRLPELDIDGSIGFENYDGGYHIDILHREIEEAVYAARGENLWVFRENEGVAQKALVFGALFQGWLRDKGAVFEGYHDWRVLHRATKLAIVLFDELEFHSIEPSQSRMEGRALGYRFMGEATKGALDKGFWLMARPEELGLTGRYFYVINQELKLGVYSSEPKLDKRSLALPPGAIKVLDGKAMPWLFLPDHEVALFDEEIFEPTRILRTTNAEAVGVDDEEAEAIDSLFQIAARQAWRQAGQGGGQSYSGLAELDKLWPLGFTMPEEGWHRGYAFDCGPGKEGRWWARARPLWPGMGRFGFVLTSDKQLHIFDDGAAEVDQESGSPLRSACWIRSFERSKLMSFEAYANRLARGFLAFGEGEE